MRTRQGREKRMEHGHSETEIAERLDSSSGPGRLRDFIYGGIDGAVTTFAIVAGVEGASLSTDVIIALGIANVLADGFSMAASNYSGTKAELDNVERLRAIERRHIAEIPDGEREEVRQILARKGLSGEVLEGAVEAICAHEKTWIDMMIVDEYGAAPVDPDPMPAAIVTFGAFMACGLVPLIPFLFGLPNPFLGASIATGVTFFAIGAMKSRWSLVSWWRSGLETLTIGAVAAALAYGAGYLVDLMT